MTKQIETLLSEVEALYAAYRNEDEDWGQLCQRIEKLKKLVVKVRKTEAKAGEYPELAIELGWLRAIGAVRDAVNAMPNGAIDRQELLAVIAYLAKNPQTH